MKISVVSINRNNAEGLCRTLKSVSTQKSHLPEGAELEHIVVDGMSDDKSLSYLSRFPGVEVYKLEPRGVYNAINYGISKTTGHIIALLHSGDVYADCAVLERIVNVFNERDDVDYIYADILLGRRRYTGARFGTDALTAGYAPPHPALFVRKELMESVGLYDESYKVAGDFDFFVRLALANNLKGLYLPEIVVEMETGGLSTRLFNRLFVNNAEKLRSLKANGLKANPLKLLTHYLYVFKGYICSTKK